MSQEQPTQQPSQAGLAAADTADGGVLVAPKSNSIGAGWSWITQAFGLFKSAWLIWIANIVLFFVVTMVLQLVPLIGVIATILLSPVLVAGLMLGAKAVDQGEELTVGHLFAGFSKNTGQLVLLGLLYAVLMVLALVPGMVVLAMSLGTDILSGDPSSMGGGVSMSTGSALMTMLGGLLILALMIPVAMAYWFAPALVVLNDQSATEAMKLSFKGSLKNIIPYLWYGVIATILYILAAIPLGLGLFVFIPVLFISMYTAYKSIFIEG